MINKIIYIVPLELMKKGSVGVINKIRQQTLEWENKNISVMVIYISTSTGNIDLLDNEIVISTLKGKSKSYIYVYINRILSTISVMKKIKEFNPDLIYSRYVLYWPFCGFMYSKLSIIEMNTNDLLEYKKKSKLFNSLYKKIRGYFLNKQDGIVCVSPEIISTIIDGRLICIPNGYKFNENNENKEYSLFNKRSKNIIFISSPNQEWQGVDKIIRLSDYFPDYEFNIIGWTQSGFIEKENVNFHGFLNDSQLDEHLSNASYAIGPLALHRKGMNQTSALKSAKYLSFNLPIIQSYYETGLDIDSILVLDNIENNINGNTISKIKVFFEKWECNNINIDEVKNKVGIERIENQRISFFSSIVN